MQRLIVTALLSSILLSVEVIGVESSISSTQPTQRGKREIEAFNYDGVRLLPSRHQEQFLQVRDFYMQLRPNDILRGFRLKNRERAPGK